MEALYAAIILAAVIVILCYFAFDYGRISAGAHALNVANAFERGKVAGRAEQKVVQVGKELPTIAYEAVNSVDEVEDGEGSA